MRIQSHEKLSVDIQGNSPTNMVSPALNVPLVTLVMTASVRSRSVLFIDQINIQLIFNVSKNSQIVSRAI